MRLEPRLYQQQIIDSIRKRGNTLVVLPTGLGKTLIALALIEDKKREGKCLFLTPTKPLARQHRDSILSVLGSEPEEVVLLTGEQPAHKRKAEYQKPILVSTPQTIRNDMGRGYINPQDISLVIFDEAHRAVGNYAYVKIAQPLTPKTTIIGLTASPGGDKKRIEEVLGNLKLKNVEVRTRHDADVKPYVKNLSFEWIPVELGREHKEARSILMKLAAIYSRKLAAQNFRPPLASKRQFMELRSKILKVNHPMKYRLLFNYSVLLHLLHLQELLETQGPYPTLKYLDKLAGGDSKSSQMLTTHSDMRRFRELIVNGGEHPKMLKLLELLEAHRGSKLIVFVQYRDNITRIVELLATAGYNARAFMGKRKDFTKKMQEETIDAFRRGDFSILVASSIGEEGLDIPAVDAVIFFEPIPSEIRSIQRRGRAGRFKDGAVYILMTKSSRDEYYYWASVKREKRMKSILKGYQEKEAQSPQPKNEDNQSRLDEFF